MGDKKTKRRILRDSWKLCFNFRNRETSILIPVNRARRRHPPPLPPLPFPIL